MSIYLKDSRVVMTLDAGGTSFRFAARRGSRQVTQTITVPAETSSLEICLNKITDCFIRVKAMCPAPPSAISFAFPGPADYPNGIIGDLGNLPCFRGGVALGPMLEERFHVPVFINNDGDLFAYGESIAGFLPHVNELLEKAGNPKRYKNLLGVTLGTGIGGGIVRNGELFFGDNSMAGEIWLLRNKLNPAVNVEEGASIRAVRQNYLEEMGAALNEPTPDLAPDPKVIEQIALGKLPGNQAAAQAAFHRLGVVAGDALGTALTLIDGLAVIGGGIARAHHLFMPALIDELNNYYDLPGQSPFRRLTPMAFNLEDPVQLRKFLGGNTCEISVPGGKRKIKYDPLQRVGVGVSRLGTSEAIALGAYAFALHKLDQQPVLK